jgi:hypothetical protein
MEDQLTPENMQLNEVPPASFCTPGKSLIYEVEQLREAVLRLCDLQRELAKKLDAALNSVSKPSPLTENHFLTIDGGRRFLLIELSDPIEQVD